VEQPRRVGLERLLATLQNKTLDGAQEQVHLLEQTPQATLLLSPDNTSPLYTDLDN